MLFNSIQVKYTPLNELYLVIFWISDIDALYKSSSFMIGSQSLQDVMSNIPARPQRKIDDSFPIIITINTKNEKIRHQLVPNAEYVKRVCAYCRLGGDKFASGQNRKTYYRCQTCEVPLCRPQTKPCFVNFHRMNFNVDSIS